MIATTGRAWISPGQWGPEAYFAFELACIGGIAINRAARSDVIYALIGFYALLVSGCAASLGDPMAVPFH
jgi:hypothetical protein